MKKNLRYIFILGISFLSLISIFLVLDKPLLNDIEGGGGFARGLIALQRSLPALDISHLFIYFFIVYFFHRNYNEKLNIFVAILAIAFSTMLVLGYSFHHTNSWDMLIKGKLQILKCAIKIGGYSFIIYVCINKVYELFQTTKKHQLCDSKYFRYIFDEHPIICIGLFLIIMWLPIIVLQYPGIATYDGVTQMKQLIGEYKAIHINIINPDVALNNHHPIATTLIMGLFIQFGRFLNNIDFGMYMYTVTQILFLIYTIAYSFIIMKKMSMPMMFRSIALAFYSCCPLFYIFAMNILKDVAFGICVFYYVLLLIEILIDADVLKHATYLLKLTIIILLVILFRNNGIYSILLSFPFMIMVTKNNRKNMWLCLVVPIIIYMVLNKIVYPALEISPGSIKEALSIPFQQTARTLNEGKEYEEKDLQIIDNVLSVTEIREKYNPVLSDPVKNTYKKSTDSKMLAKYFRVWIKYFFKYPATYIEATLNNSYGYWYPNKTNIIGYLRMPEEYVQENPFHLNNILMFQEQRDNMEEVEKLILKMPVVGTILSAGFNNWMLIIMFVYVLQSKKRKFLVAFLPLITILLVCIASPYFAIRYMLSIVYSIPILLLLCIYIASAEKTIKN